ncbi:hypothetical protein QE152_g26849 [Popillia japonica]|uniref:Ribosomal protein L20 n=1 Tax=Popillia japonica TaxID=7064 RepID=A0AAW1JXA7_POPJA
MVVRSIFTICSGIYKKISDKWGVAKHRKKLGQFSRRKHMRYRKRLRFRRKVRLRPINEYALKEYMEANFQPHNELKLSPSDRILSRLRKGWTLKETFGLKPEPRKLLTIFTEQKICLNEILFDIPIRNKEVKRNFNYNSLLTEFLTDVQIMNC